MVTLLAVPSTSTTATTTNSTSSLSGGSDYYIRATAHPSAASAGAVAVCPGSPAVAAGRPGSPAVTPSATGAGVAVDKGAIRAAAQFCEELLGRQGLEVVAEMLHNSKPEVKAAGALTN